MSRTKMTRLECSKEVRRGLNRHGVDLGYCQYSASGNEVRLTGWLCKIDGAEFHGLEIESLIMDFQRKLPGFFINGDCDNWKFTSEHIQYLAERKPLSERTERNDELSSTEEEYDNYGIKVS
jgi:hypothetical protein